MTPSQYILASIAVAAVAGLVRALWSMSEALTAIKMWAEQHQRQDDERHDALLKAIEAGKPASVIETPPGH